MTIEIEDPGRVLIDGLAFSEGPRWHEGRLWFSDMHDHKIVAVDLEGRREDIAEIANRPSGLGWLPDGRLLVVSMTDRRLLCRETDGTFSEYADLSALASFHCNDMVVDGQGRAYVGNFGFDLDAGETPRPTTLVLVRGRGDAIVVADDVAFPNGAVITPDGRTLILAESFAARLSAFDIEADGSLSNRRVWAQMSGAVPDGICLDEAGGVWVASPVSAEVLRIVEGGEVTHRIGLANQAYACMLGGADRRSMFVCTASDSNPEVCRKARDGCIVAYPAPHAGAGLP